MGSLKQMFEWWMNEINDKNLGFHSFLFIEHTKPCSCKANHFLNSAQKLYFPVYIKWIFYILILIL